MNISASSNDTNLWNLLQTSQTSSSSSIASGTTAATSSVTSTSGDGSTLSNAAKLFSSLHSLSQSNPAEFKKIAAQIATQLTAAAKASNDTNQASALTQLASNFQTASQSGNFGDLFAQSASSSTGSSAVSGAGHGGHHHHYAGGSDSDGDSTSSTSDSQTGSDPLSTIFSNALSQISADLQSSTSSSSVTG